MGYGTHRSDFSWCCSFIFCSPLQIMRINLWGQVGLCGFFVVGWGFSVFNFFLNSALKFI